MKKEDIIKQFKEYLEANKGIKDKETIINNFFSNIFYEMQDEEDLDQVNEAEEEIRKELITYSFSLFNGTNLIKQGELTKEELKESLLEEIAEELDNIEPNENVELKINIERN